MPRRIERITYGPTKCLSDKPSKQSVLFGGRYINLQLVSEWGLDLGYVSRILSGKRNPSFSYARKLADVLGILTPDGDPDTTHLFQLIEVRRVELEDEFHRNLA